MRTACAESVQFTDVSFENNWINDFQSYQSDYQSNGILIQDN